MDVFRSNDMHMLYCYLRPGTYIRRLGRWWLSVVGQHFPHLCQLVSRYQDLDEETHEMVLTEHHTTRFDTHQLSLKSLFDQRRKLRPNSSGALQTELWYYWVAENSSPYSLQTLPMPSPETL
jgi:hypothetical protein